MIDYRKFIRSKKLRMAIMSLFSWLPDELTVRIQYFIESGKCLHLRPPVTFNEKLQAYKLQYRNPVMLQCTDKLAARKFVTEKGLKEILVPLIDVKDRYKELEFEKYPEKFVIKTSDGGGGNEVFMCRDKGRELEEIKRKLQAWNEFKKPRKHIAREWAYDNGYPRKIMVEELLEEEEGKDIDDFKLYCFQGKFRFMQWHKDRTGDHRAAHYDETGKFLPEVYIYYPTFDKGYPVPYNFGEMVEIAERLSADFPFVRVDLYNVKGKIYFSELTFYPASGYYQYKPDYVDKWLGDFFEYPFK